MVMLTFSISYLRNKRLYHPDGSAEKKHQPKRRMTNNSREADVPLADILLSRAVVNGEDPAPLPKNEIEKEEEEEYEKLEETPTLPPIIEGIEEAVKRRSRRSVEEAQQAALAATATAAAAAALVKRPRSHSTEDEKMANDRKDGADNGQDESDTDSKSKRLRRSGPSSNNRSNGVSGDKKATATVTKKPARKVAIKRTKNARSRTSTPQLSDAESMPPQQEKLDEPGASAKVRYPTAKMSLWEMNRRAKQILEYISSVQVEMANKPVSFKPKASDYGASGHLEVPASPTSSVSSATTLPLDSHSHNDEATAGEQTSLEIMDRLTRELIKFQNKFSTSYHHHQHQQAQRRLHTPDQASIVANNSSSEDIVISITSATATVSHG
jgi:hypothetical protein